MKNWNDYIEERNLEKFKIKINIKIDLETTRHSDERKTRHAEEIGDDEIIKTTRKALSEITEKLILDEININDAIRIFNTTTNLNVIGTIKGDKTIKEPLTFVVITIMRKESFKPKTGTFTIKVK